MFDGIGEYIAYDPETGLLTAAKKYSKWEKGKVLGSPDKYGHLQITLKGKNYKSHRIAWRLHYGFEPSQIDHINGNPADNRIVNLREATQAENVKNARMPVTNTSGHVGVYLIEKTGRWMAKISVNNKSKHIGVYGTIEEAIRARKLAEKKYGFHPNHGRK